MEQDSFFQTASFEDILDDLSCRFIVNIPAEELVSLSRICFQVEQAHWFYEDFVREQNPHRLPSLSLRKFSKCIFDHCPMLRQYSGSHEEEFEDFLRYKKRVPVLGGILLDENWEKCILVKAWKGGSWSFPRGKINKDEPDIDCAIREVLEETGYDISPLILPEAFIELQIKEQRVKLYIIPGVPTDTPMWPQTRKEISSIGWVRLADLPGYSKRNKDTQLNIKLYMVTPFLSGLREWINQNRHLKRMLATVDEDAGEDSMQEDVVKSGTTSELIAMLRRRQQVEAQIQELQLQHQLQLQLQLQQQQQSAEQGGVDLLGMLRNGQSPAQHPIVTPQYPEQYQPEQYEHFFAPQPQYLDPTAQNSVDLLQFSPVVQPVPNDPQESIPSPERIATPVMAPSLPTDKRRNDLLSILKGSPPALPMEPNPSNGPKVGDILHLTGASPQSTAQAQSMVESSSSEYQQSLLSLFKSPKMSSSAPETTTTKPTSHQNALLAALKSPPVPRAEPQSTIEVSKTPMPTHQNSLLAALKRPEAVPEDTLTENPVETVESTSHQDALLSALKGPSKETNAPTPIKVPTSHQISLLNAFKSPTSSTLSPQLTPKDAPSPQPKVPVQEQPSRPPVKSPPPLPSPLPTTIHQASLLSALKSPTLPPTSMQLLEALKHSPVQNDHASSLLSKLRGSKEEVSEAKGKDAEMSKPGEVKNVHMEALLKTLTSPSNSPVVRPVQPASTETTTTELSPPATARPVYEETPIPIPGQNPVQTAPAASKPVSNSLLSRVKGAKPSTPPAAAPSPTQSSLLAALKGGKPANLNKSHPSKPFSPAPSPQPIPPSPPIANAQTLLSTLKSPYLNGVQSKSPSSPAPAPTHQQSPLSLFESASPPPPPPPAVSPETQQFNFSPQRQVGKRMKFRDTLVPDGVKQVSVNAAPVKSIDLSKVTLLKRPTTHESPKVAREVPSQRTTPSVPTTSDEDLGKLRSSVAPAPVAASLSTTETPVRRKTSLVENGPESPLGIEFPFRKRTPKSSRASPSLATTPSNPNAQSLLALLKGPSVKPDVLETPAGHMIDSKPQLPEATTGVETMGTERETKLVAMLERALARGVSS